MKNNTAFTLIELLVVVLIIGILAAVAVPQYQKAVNKTRFATMRTVAEIYYKAAQVYQLANGEWPDSLDGLAVDLPANQTLSSGALGHDNCGTGNGMYCCIFPKKENHQQNGIACGREDYSFAYEYYGGVQYCVAKDSDAQAVALCKAVGRQGSARNLITPTGHKTGYHYYSLQ